MKYNVTVNLDSSCRDSFSFIVVAESYLGAMIAALSAADQSDIKENQIDSITFSVNPF